MLKIGVISGFSPIEYYKDSGMAEIIEDFYTLNENIKKQDIAARYGGDKISVILRNMNADEAKYMAEYLTYSLSCCLVDDVGPVNKVSVGIATFPEDSRDKEKLLIFFK